MSTIKRNDISKFNSSEIDSKIQEIEMSMLTLRAENKPDKANRLRKVIAKLKTAKALKIKKDEEK